MIKKISADRLIPGMFVYGINLCADFPLALGTRFLLRDEAQVRTLRDRHVRAVYIDTSRGLDSEDAVPVARSAG